MSKVVTKARARAVLNERFGHTDFRAGQWEPVRAVLTGHDALVVMRVILKPSPTFSIVQSAFVSTLVAGCPSFSSAKLNAMHPTIGAASAALILVTRRAPLLPVLASLAAASIGAILAHHAVKLVYRRPRPAIALARGKTEPAFPSGHTTDATAVLATSAYLLVHQGIAPATAVVPVAIALALVTGVSRVLLGWHWPTDVLGGWLTGTAVAACAVGLYETLLRIS